MSPDEQEGLKAFLLDRIQEDLMVAAAVNLGITNPFNSMGQVSLPQPSSPRYFFQSEKEGKLHARVREPFTLTVDGFEQIVPEGTIGELEYKARQVSKYITTEVVYDYRVTFLGYGTADLPDGIFERHFERIPGTGGPFQHLSLHPDDVKASFDQPILPDTWKISGTDEHDPKICRFLGIEHGSKLDTRQWRAIVGTQLLASDAFPKEEIQRVLQELLDLRTKDQSVGSAEEKSPKGFVE